jgi:aerobic-type carbon monoxide dehydrogenase small subunit (CoxS/CutS family)
VSDRHEIRLRVNGADREARVEARATLAEVLRDDLRLTGTHLGCEHGVCGACTVLVDGRAVRSCLMFAVQLDGTGADIVTVEGLGTPEHLHPVQQAFYEAMSFQCGFCTPGFVCSTVAFLDEWQAAGRPVLDDHDLRVALSGNICRCTGYQSIVDGLALAVARLTVVDSAEGADA